MKKATLLTMLVASTAITTISALASATSIAIPAKVGAPNSIECKTADGSREVSILMGSKAPLRMNVINHASGSTWTQQLGNLKVANSPMGNLISGYELNLMDASQAFTLIVPNVLVDLENEEKTTFETKLVESFSGGMWWEDVVPAGTHITNHYSDLSCSAQFIYLTK